MTRQDESAWIELQLRAEKAEQRIAELERDRDKLRALLRRAYREAMDHDIDSRELDEKILAALGEEEK